MAQQNLRSSSGSLAMLVAMRRASSRVRSFDRDQCQKMAGDYRWYTRAHRGRRSWPSLTTRLRSRPPCPSSLGYSRMPLFMYRCPNSGYRVQGFVPEDTSEDDHVYEPVTCPVCHQIHHVNPHTGVVLGEKAK